MAFESPLTERAVISIMMRDGAFLRRGLVEGLGEDHFHAYRPAFAAIRDLHRAGVDVDAATVSAALEQSHDLEGVGGYRFIDELFRESTDGKAWRHWVKDLNGALAKRIMDDGLSLAASAKTAEHQLEALRETQEAVKAALAGPPRAKSAREAVALAIAELEYLANAGAVPGISTGLEDLDELTGGMKRGQLWAILAKTSRGKSVLMSQFACASFKAGKRTMLFSAEMMVHEVVFRAVAHRGKIDLQHLMNPKKAGGWLRNIKTQLELLAGEPLWIDDTPKMTLAHIEREAMRVADDNDGLDMIVVDYLQILKAERARGQNREEVVAGLSGGLKQLAKQMDCPVITASQVNKDGNTRESEAIAFDSDVMLSIGDEGIRIAKLRNGKRDIVLPYQLVGEFQTFVPFNPADRPPSELEEKQADTWAGSQRRGGGRDRQSKS